MLREAGKRIGDLLATRLIASKAFEGFQRQFAGCQSARLVEGDHVDACKCLDGRTARKRRPRRAPQAIAESTEEGTESTRAHGEATTRSVLARQNALARPPSGRNEGRSKTNHQRKNITKQRERIAQVYVVPNRSMNLWDGALIPWASRMRLMIFLQCVLARPA
jgi:hypothetical protein